ncbi:hypothetical protein [Sphingobium sp. EM0848]|nr:hypothetical protein [Sphingobium sp. EM0848]
MTAPVCWDELADIDSAGYFTVKDVEVLLQRAGSRTLRGRGEAHQPLPAH